MTNPQPLTNTRQQNLNRCLWVAVAGAGGFFFLTCCCVAIVLLGTLGAEGSNTSNDEDTVLQPSTMATKPSVLLEEQAIEIQDVTGEALRNFGTEMGQMENSIDALVVWVQAEGYISSQKADEVEGIRAALPSGEEIRAFYIGTKSNPGNGLAFVQVVSERESGEIGGRSLAARMEGDEANPVLILFDQEGEVRITSEKFDFSKASSRLETIQMVKFSTPNLHSLVNYAGACTISGWDEYEACFISSNNNSFLSYGVSCPTAMAAAYAAWIGTASDNSGIIRGIVRTSTIVAAINACGTAALTCLDDSMDDKPTYRLISDLKPVDAVWKSCNADLSGIVYNNRFQMTLEWSDDRLPFENKVRVYEFPPYTKDTIKMEDCGGNIVSLPVETGSGTYVNSVSCGQGEICREDEQGNASCELSSGNPQPPPVQPGQTITSRGTFKFKDGTTTFFVETNYIELQYNSNGGPVTGTGAITGSLDTSYGACPRTTFTISVTFDGTYYSESKTISGLWTSSDDLSANNLNAEGNCAEHNEHDVHEGSFFAEQGNMDDHFVGRIDQTDSRPSVIRSAVDGFELMIR